MSEDAKTSAPALTAADKLEAENEALRLEVGRLETERLAEEAGAVDATRVAALQKENERLKMELGYQQRLRGAREPKANTVEVVADVPVVPVAPAVVDDAPKKDEAGAPAPIAGKGK